MCCSKKPRFQRKAQISLALQPSCNAFATTKLHLSSTTTAKRNSTIYVFTRFNTRT